MSQKRGNAMNEITLQRSAGLNPPEAADFFMRARFFPVKGDYMAPDFKDGDLAAVAPANAYEGEGLYLLNNGLGQALYWAENVGGDFIHIFHSNARYSRYHFELPVFDKMVLGKVFASVNVMDPGALRRVARAFS